MTNVAEIMASDPSHPKTDDQLGPLVDLYADDPENAVCWKELAGLLQERIVNAAKEVAVRRRLRDVEAFTGSAVDFIVSPREENVPRICLWSRSLGAFDAWVRRVLDRAALDELRFRYPAPLDRSAGVNAVGDPFELQRQQVRVAQFFDEPFSAADRQAINDWPAAARVEILCVTGLWVKTRRDQAGLDAWARWLDDFETKRGRELPRPFPPDGFLVADSLAARFEQLALPLGYATLTLKRRWFRYLETIPVRQLECFAEFEWPF